MEQFSEKCPNCGTVNKNLYLYETEGRYICECCHREQQVKKFQRPVQIPLYSPQQLAAQLKR